jgi:hypothetical protein
MELRYGYCTDFAGQSNHGTYLVGCLKRKAMKTAAKPEVFMVGLGGLEPPTKRL